MQSQIDLTTLRRKAGDALLADDVTAACHWAEAAVAAEAGNAESIHLLALVRARGGDLGAAAELLNQALEQAPHQGTWHRDLGTVLAAATRWPEAAKALERARPLLARDAGSLALHAEVLMNCGRCEEARKMYEEARTLAPDSPAILEGLGRALFMGDRYDDAIEVLQACLEHSTQARAAHELLASIYASRGFFHVARQHRQAVAALAGDDLSALAELAVAHWGAGYTDEALCTSHSVMKAGYCWPQFHSFYIYSLLFDPGQTPGTLREAHEAWAKAHCDGEPGYPTYTATPDPDRRLRVGYLTGEFHSGPAFHYLFPILKNHDRALVEVFCYDTCPNPDQCTNQFRGIDHHWREVQTLEDEAIIRQICGDEIDVLVDVSGHFPNNRLKVFHSHPAPVQATLPNYPCTTGLKAVDYILTDQWMCPSGSEGQYTEEVVRVPSGYVPYEPPPMSPEVSPLPALRNGYVTFGLFQIPAKMNPRIWDSVAEVLRRCPTSRILIHHGQQEFEIAGSTARQRYIAEFETRGVSGERLSFRGLQPFVRHMTILGEADIALDTFPYNGQTTTCECLWMGVPVITVEGDRHVARMGYALLNRVGLGQLAAKNVEEYVESAVRLNEDLEALAKMRGGLRSQVARSCLVDGRATTRDIEAAYRWMWRRWCASQNG
jgi:tetratricopeptide (TPR) repeat protein